MLKRCKHCGEVFGSLDIAVLHRKESPLKAKCISPNAMRMKGMWKGRYDVWWANPRYVEKHKKRLGFMRFTGNKNGGVATTLLTP